MDSCGLTILFITLMSSCAGLVDSCACSSDLKSCANIFQMQVDFQTAEEICKERGGQLFTQSNALDEVARHLLDNTIGKFWIRSHGDTCSNYTTNETAQFTNWETEETPCASLCLSVSNDGKQTLRPCADKLDGFLCEDSQGELCKGSAVILDKRRCMLAPCEHRCTPLAAGYRCSCKERFRPKVRNLRHCEFYCEKTVCAALCMRSGFACWCPAGFVRSDQNCEDIDECESNHGCAHKCQNTIGSYKCACFEPFILVNETACVYSDIYDQASTTASSNFIAQGALSTPGEYIGFIIFLAVAVFALVALVFYLRGRKATVEQESNPPDYDEFQGSVST